MVPVVVLAPSNIAGLVARRFLAQGVAGSPGVAAVAVSTVPRWAEQLAGPRMRGRRPTTRSVLAATARAVLRSNLASSLATVADHPATLGAVAEAYDELRPLPVAARQAVAVTSRVTGEVVDVQAAMESRLADDWYDTETLLETATDVVLGSDLRTQVVLYLPQTPEPGELRLLRAVADAGRLHVVAALTGVPRPDAALHRALEQLGAAPGGEDVEQATADRVMTSSDSDDEVRCVVREVVTTLQSTRADRVAVLYSARAPYARLLHEHLAAAGVSVNGPGSRPVQERAVARILLEVLALPADDVARGALFDAVAHAPTRDLAGRSIPLTGWERISRSAGVVRGDDWQQRLELYAADRRTEADQLDQEEGPGSGEGARRNADQAEALREFAVGLRTGFAHADSLTSWAELSAWCLNLFTTLVGEQAELQQLPVEEQYAAAAITSTLRGLGELDRVAGDVSLAALRDLLTLELGRALPRVGRFGEGVLVAPLSAAVGLDLDHVFLVGLSEDLYPGRQREDALLPAAARAAAPDMLRGIRDRMDERHRHLLIALASAPEAVVSFPRGDLRRSTRRLPLRWLLPTLRHLSGEPMLSATGWEAGEYDSALTSSGSFAGQLMGAAQLATEQEWRIRASAAGGLHDVVVASATELADARAGTAFTRFDGHLAGAAGLPDYAHDDTPVSPTRLEQLADCPHAFFVERLLGVRPVEVPEDVVQISPLDLGTLVHESLDQLIHEFEGRLPGFGEPWSLEQRQRLDAITTERAQRMQARGLTGHPRLWERDQTAIRQAMAELLAEDEEERATTGARVVRSELAFGMGHGGPEPVEVALPEGRLRMRGSADKVDQAADGRLYVTDIKTGSDRKYKAITQDNPLAGGTRLQLPVYGYAAREQLADRATPVEASYWFVMRNHGRRRISLTPEVESEYARVLDILVRSIANGLFPVRPPVDDDYGWIACRYCNPDGVGYGPHRDRWQRKRTDPALAELVGLLEPATTGDAS
ncbi:PD-(D/E)XK nuclease family protein [Auraticoccus sp. F435]|uniref:PD-(D/E)XK nuclease family protein n=1 Tax=Auraticoccus cholistanensis TaxID=2656650 RepID=A0A6A9UPM4_9ACTN|nr:PD-(D/E)XK nuclease family protein [Auraticoccus cholistanensis]